MPMPSPAFTGFCGTVTMMMGMRTPAWRTCSATSRPLTLPWSRASTISASGRSSRIWSMTIRAVGDGIEQADLLLMLQEIAHVLRDLRDVFDE